MVNRASDYLERARDILYQAHEQFPWEHQHHQQPGTDLEQHRHITPCHWRLNQRGKQRTKKLSAGCSTPPEIQPDDRRTVHNAMAAEIFLALRPAEARFVRHGGSSATRAGSGSTDRALPRLTPRPTTRWPCCGGVWRSFNICAGEDPLPALAQAENSLRRLLDFDPDHESGLIKPGRRTPPPISFSAPPSHSEDLEQAADEALAIYRRLERPDANPLEFGCLIA